MKIDLTLLPGKVAPNYIPVFLAKFTLQYDKLVIALQPNRYLTLARGRVGRCNFIIVKKIDLTLLPWKFVVDINIVIVKFIY